MESEYYVVFAAGVPVEVTAHLNRAMELAKQWDIPDRRCLVARVDIAAIEPRDFSEEEPTQPRQLAFDFSDGPHDHK